MIDCFVSDGVLENPKLCIRLNARVVYLPKPPLLDLDLDEELYLDVFLVVLDAGLVALLVLL